MLPQPIATIKNDHPGEWVIIQVVQKEGSLPDRGYLLYANKTLDSKTVGQLIAEDQNPHHDILIDFAGALTPEGSILIL